MHSRLLVAAQFLSLAGIAVLGPLPEAGSMAAASLAMAIGLGTWSIVTVGRRSFRVLPEPKTDGQLVTSGPYRWVRHPMYTSLLIAATGLVIDAPTAPRVVSAVVLTAVLAAKVRREERLLDAKYGGYAAYRARTRRIVPWVF